MFVTGLVSDGQICIFESKSSDMLLDKNPPKQLKMARYPDCFLLSLLKKLNDPCND